MNLTIVFRGLLKNWIVVLGIDFADRAHRIGPCRASDVDRQLHQQITVRFSSFRDRTTVYRNRKKLNKVKILLNVTRKRLNTLKLAFERASGCRDINFVFADINCNLAAKMIKWNSHHLFIC